MALEFLWVFCRFAGSLGDEGDALQAAASDYNAACGLPLGKAIALLTCAQVLPAHRAVVDDNIRMSRAFVLIAEESWESPPASFRHDFKLALKCKADPGLPLQHIALFFRKLQDDDEGEDRLGAFRRTIDPASGIQQFDFADATEFRAQVDLLFSEWFRYSL